MGFNSAFKGLRKKLVKCYIWSISCYGSDTSTLRKVDHKCLESFEIRCWRRMENISWTDRVRNGELNVHGSVYRKNILIYIQQDATLHSLFYLETALRVSGGTTTHHQECKQLFLQHLVFVTPL